MKNTIKLAAFGAVALAASSSAVLAGSQLTPGISTGIALGAPLPEGVYDITIGLVQQGNTDSTAAYTLQTPPATGANTPVGGLEAVIPVWLIWSTPWQIAGGHIQIDGTIPWASVDTAAATHPQLGALAGNQGWLNGLVESSIKWNLGNGWNFAFGGGAWLGSDSSLLGIQDSRFMGQADIAYIAGGWEVLANFFIGSGANNNVDSGLQSFLGVQLYNPAWFNYDLTVARKFGKFTIGAIAYGSADLENGNMMCPLASAATLNGLAACKQSQFAVGGLVGYDFGSFSATFKLSQDVSESNYGVLNTTGWLTIVKPLWSPESGPLK